MYLESHARAYTDQLSRQGLLRKRTVPASTNPARNFSANDYLSLTRHQGVAAAYQNGYRWFAAGSGGSMVLSGYHANHQALEQAFASWLGVDACVLFASGYAANLAVANLLGVLKAHCLIDKAVHASCYDGLQLANVSFRRFVHNAVDQAELGLRVMDAPKVLLTEGIFSMSGHLAPLTQLASACTAHCADLIVDEAHAVGVIGEQGRGAVSHHGLTQREVPLRILPLGKAFAGQGAIVAGDAAWLQALVQAARPLIYSTAISPALSYGLRKTLDIVAAAEDRRRQLMGLVDALRVAIQQSPLPWSDSASPIQQVQLGCPRVALQYEEALARRGFLCSAIRQPTVSLQHSGLRIILNYHHTWEDVQHLLQALAEIYDSTP